jgi:hypothetical protein
MPLRILHLEAVRHRRPEVELAGPLSFFDFCDVFPDRLLS